MVHFANSHIAFITLLALTAINSGESTSVSAITRRLAKINGEIPVIIADIKNSEVKVKNATDKILSQNASLQGEIKKYTDCLENSYKYGWGSASFDNLLLNFPRDPHKKLVDAKNCLQQEFLEYKKNNKAFPTNKCFVNMPPAPQPDLHQLNVEVYTLYDHRYLLTIKLYGKALNQILLKGL
ncbi:unnamed protein product [Trichobilharzia szidati]|nr:unnamed protein product [Trichobilharzia szidati]